jgi:hypothetical protein
MHILEEVIKRTIGLNRQKIERTGRGEGGNCEENHEDYKGWKKGKYCIDHDTFSNIYTYIMP